MNNLSLVEKYRPNNIDNIFEQNSIINALKKTIINKNIPHLLLYGPSGVGKTSVALSLVKTLFNKHNYKERVLELNASDERGIQIVREKIKNFAKMSINNDNDAKFKVIILDEADSMTLETQLALRYIIEQYSKYTRFIIICNYINKIIEPIISRCALYRFKPIQKKTIKFILKNICSKENIKLNDRHILSLYDKTDGDLRYSINLLEKYKLNNNILGNNVDIKYYTNILLNNLLKKNKIEIPNIINKILNLGISANEILLEIIDLILINKEIDDDYKYIIYFNISGIDNKLKNGCEDYIQLMYLSQIILNI